MTAQSACTRGSTRRSITYHRLRIRSEASDLNSNRIKHGGAQYIPTAAIKRRLSPLIKFARHDFTGRPIKALRAQRVSQCSLRLLRINHCQYRLRDPFVDLCSVRQMHRISNISLHSTIDNVDVNVRPRLAMGF